MRALLHPAARRVSTPLLLLIIALGGAGIGCAGAPTHRGGDGLPPPNAIALKTAPAGFLSGSERFDVPASAGEPYLLLNQRFVEGLRSRALKLGDVDAMFWHVFSRLPEEVVVYPSENYYYFIINVQGRQIWGNIRIPAGKREHGKLSFGYFEFIEFPQLKGPKTGLSNSKFYGPEDGLVLTETANLTWRAEYRGKSVTFHLYPLPQEPPRLFGLGSDEIFIERTFDESGYQFFLLFNTERNYFIWVLNEEPGVPDTFAPDPITRELVIGKRSGFAFWVDRDHDGRKVLVAIRRLNSNRNDYYDGPFDQLADNYAKEVRISEYMQLAAPGLRGRIDEYGYYTDKERPMRVALACYYSYLAPSDLRKFFERAKQSEDVYQYISRRGIPTYPQKGAESPTGEGTVPGEGASGDGKSPDSGSSEAGGGGD